MNSISNHLTNLDTTGRPAITLKYRQLTYRHVGVIYVSRNWHALFFRVPKADLRRLLGRVLSAAFSSSEKASRCCDRVDGHIRACLYLEARRYSDPEVMYWCNRSLRSGRYCGNISSLRAMIYDV